MTDKGKIKSPPDIAGFIYFYTATTICSVLPQDTPTKHFTEDQPNGKHKLKQGGYKCTESKFCVQAYCYDCAINHFGNNGQLTLKEYHRAFCKAHTGAVNPRLKRRIDEHSPHTSPRTRKRHTLDRSSTPESSIMDREASAGPSSKREEEASPLDEPMRRFSRSASKKQRFRTDSDEAKDASDLEDELSARKAPLSAISERKPKGLSDSDEDLKSDLPGPCRSVRPKKPLKASVKNLPTPPVPPKSRSNDPRDLPGASWPSTNFISRTPDPNRSREPEVYQPPDVEYRKVPTNADFFTSEPDGQGSWRFPDDPYFKTHSTRQDTEDSDQGSKAKKNQTDAAEKQDSPKSMTYIAEDSEPRKEGKTWYQDKRSSSSFEQAQEKAKEQQEDSAKKHPRKSSRVLSAEELSAEERLEQTLTDADHHQISIAGRDRSATTAHEDDDFDSVEHPVAVAQSSPRARHAQNVALASTSRYDDIPYAEPGSLNANYPELHHPAKATNPAATARAQQKQRLAKRDNPAMLDENVLSKLRRAQESARTSAALRDAIGVAEALMPLLLTDTVRLQFEAYLEELKGRLVGLEGELVGVRGPETPPDTARKRASTPVSPRTKRPRVVAEEEE